MKLEDEVIVNVVEVVGEVLCFGEGSYYGG